MLLAARDISLGEMTATQQQKFNTDDLKSVQNLVMSSDSSMY